ncbi:hypothetical protein IGI04_013703, partial [Brassica rapa subsp. trilocularis]
MLVTDLGSTNTCFPFLFPSFTIFNLPCLHSTRIIQGLDLVVVGGGENIGMDGKLVGREGIVVGNEGKVGIGIGGIEVGIVGRVVCGNVDGNGGIEVGMVGRVGCGNVDGNGGTEVGIVGKDGCGKVDGNGGRGCCWRRWREAEHMLIVIEKERVTKKAMRKILNDAIL